jgi:hypothetical protein
VIRNDGMSGEGRRRAHANEIVDGVMAKGLSSGLQPPSREGAGGSHFDVRKKDFQPAPSFCLGRNQNPRSWRSSPAALA